MTVKSVEKAFRMLDAFDPSRPVMGLTQLAAVLDIDKSEAQRFAHTLTELGYLRKDPVTRSLQLTVKALGLAHSFLRTNSVLRVASAYLTHLNKLTEETVNLAMLDDTDIVIVQRIVSRHVFNENVVIGARLPAFCTAAGRAILARLDEDAALDILKRSPLKPYTSTTVWRSADLLAQLQHAAKQGYAVTNGEFYSDISVGAAVVDARGAPVAAVSVSASSAMVSAEDAERRFAALVMEASRSISA